MSQKPGGVKPTYPAADVAHIRWMNQKGETAAAIRKYFCEKYSKQYIDNVIRNRTRTDVRPKELTTPAPPAQVSMSECAHGVPHRWACAVCD